MGAATEPPEEVPTVVIYGDFNCPFSAAASFRSDRVEQSGSARIDWHAVEHAPDMPTTSELFSGESAAELDRELRQIRELLTDDERCLLLRPSRQVNTEAATLAYAAATPDGRRTLRRSIFTAYWQHDADINDGETLAGLGASGGDATLASAWRRSWRSLPQPIVPAMVLPDGYVSRGLGVLARLGAAMNGRPEGLRGR